MPLPEPKPCRSLGTGEGPLLNVGEVNSLVEQEVARLLGMNAVERDSTGDIVAASGSTLTYIRVMDGPTGTMIRFLAPLVKGVARSMELLERLNDLNARTPYVRFFWLDDHVFCGMELAGDDLQWKEIGNALSAITGHADHVDDVLCREFGGSLMVKLDAIDDVHRST